MTRKHTPKKSFRCANELWDAAQEAAEWRGDRGVSTILRAALTTYVKQTNRMRQAAEQRSEHDTAPP